MKNKFLDSQKVTKYPELSKFTINLHSQLYWESWKRLNECGYGKYHPHNNLEDWG